MSKNGKLLEPTYNKTGESDVTRIHKVESLAMLSFTEVLLMICSCAYCHTYNSARLSLQTDWGEGARRERGKGGRGRVGGGARGD